MRHRMEVGRLGGRSVGIKKRPEGREEGHMEKGASWLYYNTYACKMFILRTPCD